MKKIFSIIYKFIHNTFHGIMSDIELAAAIIYRNEKRYKKLFNAAIILLYIKCVLYLLWTSFWVFICAFMYFMVLLPRYMFKWSIQYHLEERILSAFQLLITYIQKKLKKYIENYSPLEQVYTTDIISEILYDTLKKNYVQFNIVCPSSIKDIFPTERQIIQSKNGFTIFYYICRHQATVTVDTKDIRKTLNLTIAQHLQTHFNNYLTKFNGICVVRVLCVDEDKYHPGCYSFELMIVDNQHKYKYVKHLEKHKFNNNNLDDEDF